MNLATMTLIDARDAVRRRDVTARALTEAALDALRRGQGDTNAAALIEAERALGMAEAVDAAIAAGRDPGPLAGVPLAHKDMMYRTGRRAACGSRVLGDHVPDVTATVLARLDAAGAIDCGTLNMAELAYNPTGHNAHTGHVRNPWNGVHIPGGSSSGSGAAVAAGAVFAALGSDTGGSIRFPASCCGVTGIKPTLGRVPRSGTMGLCASLDTIGPLARSVHDCALVLAAIAGADPEDPHSDPRPVPDWMAAIDAGADGLTIGVIPGALVEGVDPGIAAALAEAVSAWRHAGARVVELAPPDLVTAHALAVTVLLAEAAATQGHWLDSAGRELTPVTAISLRKGREIDPAAYADALARRRLCIDTFCAEVFARCDALLLPILPIPVPRLDETDWGSPSRGRLIAAMMRHTPAINYLGLPALALPCGFDAKGLPIGHQLVGRPFEEGTLFRLGAAFQAATDWHRRHPPHRA
ncbi:amidase [Elioraea tepidiphila]|uniref:amidase n=1 Tax=Elioraea tepidiphila TaxID=457934 RepID=UPI000687EAC6|nr:amidase [Elioraea tepidiphila]